MTIMATSSSPAVTSASASRPDKPGRPGLLGRKVGMTQIFDAESGAVVPVTVIEAGPCPVTVVRTPERDGYAAVQIGFANKPRRLASRSVRGQVAKLDGRRAKRRAEAGVATLPPFFEKIERRSAAERLRLSVAISMMKAMPVIMMITSIDQFIC